MKTDKYIALANRSVIEITGPESRNFLQGLITNDVKNLDESQAIYAALLTPQGKYLHDFFIIQLETKLLLDCRADRINELLARLNRYKLRAKVEIKEASAEWSIYAVFVAKIPEKNKKLVDKGVCFKDPRHEALGYRAILPADTIPKSIPSEGMITEYDSLRLSLGIPEDSLDMLPEKIYPLEARLDEFNAISFNKGCYVGQEVTIRMKHRNLIKKRLIPVSLSAEVKWGTTIEFQGKNAGKITSGQGKIAIALLRVDLADNEELMAGDTKVLPLK